MKNRRERAKQVRQRKVVALAAYSYTHSVKNSTIPKVDNNKIIEEVSTWNKERKLQKTKETAIWDANKWYKEQRDKIKKEIKDNTYSTNNLTGKYKYIGRRKPWYMLDTHKTYHYETRKMKWGDKTDFFRVLSEAEEMYNRTIIKPKGRAWFMEKIVQHKLAKWERKNPCPVKPNQNPPDMFEEEYITPWKAQREIALERIRNFVVSIYDKLPLTGRFKKSDNEFVEERVAEIKDKQSEGHDINSLDPKESKLLKKAQEKTDKVKAKRTNLVCTNLRDHKRQKGRIILPKAA